MALKEAWKNASFTCFDVNKNSQTIISFNHDPFYTSNMMQTLASICSF